MTSPDDTQEARLAELEDRILGAAADEPVETADGIAERSSKAHRAIVRGNFGHEPTELRVRLHGEGVQDHRVPADQAGALLRQTQLVVRWIGARLRSEGDEKQ